MDLKVDGNPGQGNTFEENTYKHIDDYYDHPTIYHQERNTRMASDFQRLRQEILNGVKAETIEELKQYITILDGRRTFEEKLEDGGFKPSGIQDASKKMLLYAKKSEKLDCYPSAQQIFSDLFAFIKNEFYNSVFPLIEDGRPLREVMAAIRTNIVNYLMKILNDNGAYDEDMHLNEDHIYGMLYYLTGMCHINWKDYENV